MGGLKAARQGWHPALSPHIALPMADESLLDRFRLALTGAARAIAQRLRRAGGVLVVPPKDFRVTGTQPVLLDGELDAARAWGAALVARAAGGR